jgi:cell division transport system permease protein
VFALNGAQLAFIGRRVRNSLWHLLWSHLLTSVTMAMTLFVFGALMLVQHNLQGWLKGWGDEIQINAYLDKSLDAAGVQRLLDHIRAFPEVERVRYISQRQAWQDFRAALGTQATVLEGLPENVLPASFEIWVKPAFRDGPLVEQLAGRVRAQAGVATVEYPQEWVERLSLVVLVVQWAKWIVAGVLFVVTFFIVGSTVRLAILARKDEIEIMQLVGASEEMIQAPFVLEGMIQGLAGGLASIVCLWSLFQLLRLQMADAAALFGPLSSLKFLEPASLALILAIGWILGATGSLFSLRRFMKTWRG